MSPSSAIEIVGVDKIYGSGPTAALALDNVSLQVLNNEFFTLLGPSGCGKTTLLRIMAGFETVTNGDVMLYGEKLAHLPPDKRPINTVFQNYALFPHLSVAENVAFGLQMLGRDTAQINKRVDDMLALVQMSAMAKRKPSELSGGQQQRVALARALAPAPKVLLLDEPLSALDLKLRQKMRSELKQIQKETGITFIFVTHDQEEALSMSDRIAVMSAGKVQQVGQPKEIYDAPKTRFVADFIGETNLFEADVISNNGSGLRVRVSDAIELSADGDAPEGRKAFVSIRPEHIELCSDGDVPCTIDELVYLGTDTQYVVRLKDGATVLVRAQNAHGARQTFAAGQAATLRVQDGAARVLAD
ncbi:MAG: ABC transporter ATP-binding protein [Pseudomonadota bacterium]